MITLMFTQICAIITLTLTLTQMIASMFTQILITTYEAKRRGPAPPSQIDQNIALIN